MMMKVCGRPTNAATERADTNFSSYTWLQLRIGKHCLCVCVCKYVRLEVEIISRYEELRLFGVRQDVGHLEQ